MTQTHSPLLGAFRKARSEGQDETLVKALKSIEHLLQRHFFGSPEHLEVVKGLTKRLQDLQREGLVTAYELGNFTHDTVHVHVFVSLEDFTLEKRQRIRRELRTVGRAHSLYVDSHIQPDLGCGETE